MTEKSLVVLDANSILHRAFHALPPLTTKKGEDTGALYGFLLTLFKVVEEIKPDYLVGCFDTPAPTLRHKEFKEYKAKRPETPKTLVGQIIKTKDVLRTLNIPVFEKEGFEADDLIGTVVKKSQKKQIYPLLNIYIVSGDLDILQLASDNVNAYILQKGVKNTIIYNKRKIVSKFGLLPSQIVDFKALAGDPSDNIPGVPGIGKKTATKLIKEFGSLENLYSAFIGGKKISALNQRLQTKLEEYKDQAFLSGSLALIKDNAPIEFNLIKCQWQGFNKKKALELFKSYEFYSLINRFSQKKLISF